MPKLSKATAENRYHIPGLFDAAVQELDGYSVDIESYEVDIDDAAKWYRGLPNDQCPGSHVGYVMKGRLTVRMADGTEEVFEAGDAYVIKPGHTPETIAAGSEFVSFTLITEETKAANEVVQANMMKYLAERGIELPG